jgi:hypothetical protein
VAINAGSYGPDHPDVGREHKNLAQFNQRHETRVHLIAPLPSLIHCRSALAIKRDHLPSA